MITPAISVLSAVEGLRVVRPELEPLIIPITVVIIVGLFAVQRAGTAKVGRSFGPVMALWFSSIGLVGAMGIAAEPGVLRALSPTYAISFVAAQPASAFFALAAVVLAITGAEAIYADLGHFGRNPIALAWLLLVYPACTLSYFGQGASILANPDAIRAPFFLLVPAWAQLPMVLLATAATVIASQAVITGAFSVARQAVQLGYLPRLRILHTSSQTIGQIYVPYVNWGLMIAVVALVLAFQTSAALAYAFGMAVTGTIIITTLLLFYLARTQWRWPLWRVLLVGGPILALEGLFLAANLTKLVHGAWLPLLIGVALFTVFTTWQRGRQLVTARREAAEGPLRAFVDDLHEQRLPVQRVPDTAVFLNRGRETAPLAMRSNVRHNHVLHERVVIVAVETIPVPIVRLEERAVSILPADQLPDFTQCVGNQLYERASDPWVSFAPNGDAHQISLSFNNTANLDNAILVSKSPAGDAGQQWSAPITLKRDTNPAVFNDKESITADQNDANYVYAIWDRLVFPSERTHGKSYLNTSAFRGPTWFSRTTNGGSSWETARPIFDPGQNDQTIGNQIVALGNGDLANVMTVFRNDNKGKQRGGTVAVLRSSNRGTSWSGQINISRLGRVGVTDPEDGHPVRTGDIIPEIASDERAENNDVYVVWQDARFNNFQRDQVAFSRSTDGGPDLVNTGAYQH